MQNLITQLQLLDEIANRPSLYVNIDTKLQKDDPDLIRKGLAILIAITPIQQKEQVCILKLLAERLFPELDQAIYRYMCCEDHIESQRELQKFYDDLLRKK